MARKPRPETQEADLRGFKYFKKLLPFLQRLRDNACARDGAGNRKLHFDQYICLLLLYFFTPVLTSMRAIQQGSGLEKVRKKLGSPRASLGQLSEAARVFDADLLLGIVGDLAAELKPLSHDPRLGEIDKVLTLVDGTLLKALPKLVEAMWLDGHNKAFKLHMHFELLKAAPVRADLTDANASERDRLAETLSAGRLYVLDRGYAAFSLFRRIVEAGSSFVCRVRDNSVYEVIEPRRLSEEARARGVLRDEVVRLGDNEKRREFAQPVRLVQIACQPHRKRQHTSRGGPEQGEVLLIATDLMDLPAELIALIYQQRWAIEIFFRFFKHVLGAEHLLSHSRNGIQIQTYVALIAAMVITLWSGKKLTRRTYEMLCFYFMGWATEQELEAHLATLQDATV